MSRSGLTVILSCVGLAAFGLIYISITTLASDRTDSDAFKILQQPLKGAPDSVRSAMDNSPQFWKTANMLKDDIPESLLKAADSRPVQTGILKMTEGAEVFYQYSAAAADASTGQFVLLLHGAAFTSQNWRDIGTIALLAAMGHTPVAVDIPGYGKSKGSIPSAETFVASLIAQLRTAEPFAGASLLAAAPVLVSPSMSGAYSVPVLVTEAARGGAPSGALISAYVPVAPGSTNLLTSSAAQKIQIPTLIVYGSRDHGLGRSATKDLAVIPTSQAVEVPDAGHPAYISQPQYFHKLLYNFLTYVRQRSAHTP